MRLSRASPGFVELLPHKRDNSLFVTEDLSPRFARVNRKVRFPGQRPGSVQSLALAGIGPPLRRDHVVSRGAVAVAIGQGLDRRPGLSGGPIPLALTRREERPDTAV